MGKISFYEIDLMVHNIPLEFSRQGDKWIMVAFMNTGYSLKELLKLNLVRIHQQVLFISDVLGVGCYPLFTEGLIAVPLTSLH